MALVKAADKEVELNEDGFLVDPAQWTEEVARAIAAQHKLDLNDRHLVVLNYMRKDYQENSKSPTIRRITKNSGVTTKELYQLFPVRPGGTAARIAGVPKPEGCV